MAKTAVFFFMHNRQGLILMGKTVKKTGVSANLQHWGEGN